MRGWRRQFVIGACLVLATAGGALSASDPSMTSSSYSVVESEVGGNGCSQVSGTYTCGASSNYSLNPATDDGGSSLGESAVGNSASSNYQTNSGFDTTSAPGLMLAVTTSSINLGNLTTAAANTATATFSVRDYTSSGYVVQVVGSTPSYGGHNLVAMTPSSCSGANWGCASVAGSEQFGLNLVHNTSPVAVGADPVCQASGFCVSNQVAGDGTGTYGLNGTGGTPYTVDGRYKFVSGDVVAHAPSSSGETDYTITFLANMSNSTPAGQYSGNLSIVATGTY